MQYNITYRIKDNSFQYIISYKDHTGKWKQKAKQGFKSFEQAKEAAAQYIEHFNKINLIDNATVSIGKKGKNNLRYCGLNRKKYNNLKNEIWKDVVGYEGLYKVSNMGRVLSLRRKNVFSLCTLFNGYPMVSLVKDGITCTKTVHSIVAKAFIPNPENKPIVDHINTNRKDNKVENLRWVTQKENMNNEITKENTKRTKEKNKKKRNKKLNKIKF